jgi:hypothetical protein
VRCSYVEPTLVHAYMHARTHSHDSTAHTAAREQCCSLDSENSIFEGKVRTTPFCRSLRPLPVKSSTCATRKKNKKKMGPR